MSAPGTAADPGAALSLAEFQPLWLDLTRERVRQLEGQALKRLEALRDLAGLAA